jgi:NAD(P)-dependent dehydrogenase (short-subunit alcohol dehydrogenase family)
MGTTYEGKTVVITGGTSGIGLTTAERLLDAGARVLVTGRSEDSLDAARERLGDRAVVVRSDVSASADREALADRVKAEFGSLDLLFANAGITRHAPFEQVTEEQYDETFAINAKGLYFTVQKLVPLIPDGGSIVLTTSVVNVMGLPMTGVYSASKAAVRSMVRTMAAELMPRGIRVNAVSPGPIDTGILQRSQPPEVAEKMLAEYRAMIPMGRLGLEDEIVRAVVFLAFEATFSTGTELAVDGGGTQL